MVFLNVLVSGYVQFTAIRGGPDGGIVRWDKSQKVYSINYSVKDIILEICLDA